MNISSRRLIFILPALLIIGLCFSFFGCVSPDDHAQSGTINTAVDPSPHDNALHFTGPIGDGEYVLPNGRRITPAGRSQWVPHFPNDVKVAPDGKSAVVLSFYRSAITMVDTTTMEVVQQFNPGATFLGIEFNAAGDRFWVGGGDTHSVQEYAYVDGVATPLRDMRLWGYPAGLALSNDEQKIYVCANTQNRVAEIDLQTGIEGRSAPTQLYPYDLVLLPDGSKLYASNWGGSSVTAIDPVSMTTLADIPTGKNPTRLVVSPEGSHLYSADADTDTITVIDTINDVPIVTWPLHGDAIDGEVKIGSFPSALDISADGSRLYVTSSGYYCISVIDTTNGDILGRIPTGWFTTGVDLDDETDTLWAINGKGFGSAATMPSGWTGTIQSIALPSTEELNEYTAQVEENISWGHSFFDTAAEDFASPIPTEFGKPSEQIKHVIFVLKENKTYDQIFGGLEGTERDPKHLVFGEDVTPNHHKLAREFTIFDNFYVEGDASVIGHFWATALQCNEFAEKMYFINLGGGGRYPLSTLEPPTIPAEGKFLWNTLIDHDIDFRVYGQIVGMSHDLETLMPHMNLKYGFWNMGTLDVDKVKEFIREVDGGYFPPLVYILLPNDHNYGSSSGSPTADFLVGDNDAGLGDLVDYISHSEYWKETAIFVMQDDPQSGSDHIDKHRSGALVISPWAKRGKVSSVMYSGSSMWLTIDLILGIPPTTKFDQYTAPMYDAFTMTPDFTPYDALPNPIPYELNPKGLPFQDYCDQQNFLVPDQVPSMGKVYWALKRPGEQFPYDLSVDAYEDEEEEAEEAREAQEYLRDIERIKAYANKHGLEMASESPFWQVPSIVERLEKHNKKLKEKGSGGY